MDFCLKKCDSNVELFGVRADNIFGNGKNSGYQLLTKMFLKASSQKVVKSRNCVVKCLISCNGQT